MLTRGTSGRFTFKLQYTAALATNSAVRCGHALRLRSVAAGKRQIPEQPLDQRWRALEQVRGHMRVAHNLMVELALQLRVDPPAGQILEPQVFVAVELR